MKKKILFIGSCGYQELKFIPIILNKNSKIFSVDAQRFGFKLKNIKLLTMRVIYEGV